MAFVALISGALLWLTSPIRGWLQIHRDNGMVSFKNEEGIVSSRQLGKYISINLEVICRFCSSESLRAILSASNDTVVLCTGRRGQKFIRIWLKPVAEWLNVPIKEFDREYRFGIIPLRQKNFPFNP
jgi:hypothetical protein